MPESKHKFIKCTNTDTDTDTHTHLSLYLIQEGDELDVVKGGGGFRVQAEHGILGLVDEPIHDGLGHEWHDLVNGLRTYTHTHTHTHIINQHHPSQKQSNNSSFHGNIHLVAPCKNCHGNNS